MPCRSPLRQYHAASGWSFNAAKPHTEFRDLNCGVCMDCRIRKAREWAIRCYHESKMHERSSFVDLTYADNPVTLTRRDVTLFFKSLRNAGYRFRYFGCGEYGENTLRPHYHLILFGIDFSHDRYPWKRSKKGTLLYRSPTLEEHWQHGNATLSDVSPKAAEYAARYNLKKINGKAADEADPDTGLRPYDRVLPDNTIFPVAKEMLFCSKRPAIGLEWFLKYGNEVYPRDFVVMNGKEYRPPQYYDSLVRKYRPDIWEKVVDSRLEHIDHDLTDQERERICKAKEANRNTRQTAREPS